MSSLPEIGRATLRVAAPAPQAATTTVVVEPGFTGLGQPLLQLLAQHSLSVEAVAHATGYRDPSSFHRAFRAWTGVTPAVYRARLKAGGPAGPR